MPKRLIMVGLILFAVVASTSAYSLTPIDLAHGPEQFNLIEFAEVLAGADEDLTLDGAMDLAAQNRFVKLSTDYLAFPRFDYVIWLRFRIGDIDKKGSTRDREWLVGLGSALFSEADLYVPPREKPFNVHRDSRLQMLLLPDGLEKDQVVYLRLKNNIQFVAAPQLITHQAHHRSEWVDFLLFGMFYGAILAVLLFNLYLSISVKEKTYLLFALFLGSSLGWQFCIFGHLDLYTDIELSTSMKIQMFFAGCSYLWASLFNRSFLDLKSNAPKLDKVLILLAAVSLVVTALTPFISISQATKSTVLIQLVLTAVSVPAGILRVRQGFRPGMFFLLVYIISLLNTILYILVFSGVAVDIPAFYIHHSIAFTIAATAVLLSFAQGSRMAALKEQARLSEARKEQFKQLSITDQLTGLFNKRWFDEKLDETVEEAHRVTSSLSLLMMDVDHFKKFNDTFGHPAGDVVLETLGAIVRDQVRSADVACRYGGEEFAVILPSANDQVARRIAERIRTTFKDHTFKPTEGTETRATISVGVAVLEPGEDRKTLLSRADKALYRAKSSGRDQTVVF